MISFIFSSFCGRTQTYSHDGGGLGQMKDRLQMFLAATNLLVGDLQQVQHHSVGAHVL